VLATLQLEIPTTLVASNCPSPTVRVESHVEAARIHHLEVPMSSTAVQLQVPMVLSTLEVGCVLEKLQMAP
jgi:hypothetical protein